ncbi:MAG: transposase, partial [Gammaproteobacteria bacterium]|nr:transposase [Gammaproteobacteria bacterium]
MQPWIAQELASSDLGDQRLDRRYALLLDRLSQRPNLSIPAACQGWDETLAAYRFFDNDRVTPDKRLLPHRDAALKRIAAQSLVLLAQDTTELELTRRQEQVGGPLRDQQHFGLHVHPLWAMTPEGVPLGVLAAEIWARDAADFHQRSQRQHQPIEQKESYRWLVGYRQACALAEQVPGTQVVCLSDSEGDIYECFVEAASAGGRKADWVVRACQDRRLADPRGTKLCSAVAA